MRFDAVSFIAGLICLAFAGAFLFTDYHGFALLDLRYVLPLALIAVGGYGIIRALLGARRQQ